MKIGANFLKTSIDIFEKVVLTFCGGILLKKNLSYQKIFDMFFQG